MQKVYDFSSTVLYVFDKWNISKTRIFIAANRQYYSLYDICTGMNKSF